MPILRKFDVLIVYSGAVAVSAAASKRTNRLPFPPGSRNESCNSAYSYFLKSCEELNVKAAFTTSRDIVGPGTCQSYWSFTDNAWHKHRTLCSAPLIFDKFSPKSTSDKALRKLLFSSNQVQPFNDPVLRKLFSDKQKMYDTLSEHAIPTISMLGDTLENINQACDTLTSTMSNHHRTKDFSHDIIMKDRYGAGGNHVYKFKSGESKDMLAVTSSNPHISFVLQPFAKFDKGYSYKKGPGSTDIRLIYLGGKLVESYLRTAKPNDFRCNEHQGGSLTYLPIKDIPHKLITKAKDIITKLHNQNSLYSLDFIISNSGTPYLLEGNTGPGLDWNLSVKKEELNAKKFIRRIVKELSFRTNASFT